MINLTELTEEVGNLNEDKILSMLDEFVKSNPSEEDAQLVVSACQKGMTIVGDLFEKNEYFVGDLIFAGEILNSALDIIKSVLGQAITAKVGSIVIATVEGDLHDIGKNIFKGMAEAAGFEVYDLGIDAPANAFVEKIIEVKPNIVGMSGVLTLSINSMKKTVEAIQEAGLRNRVKVIIGGNPVTAEACKSVGADAFTTNAAEGIKICQSWV